MGRGRVLQVERARSPRPAGRPSRPGARAPTSSRMRAITVVAPAVGEELGHDRRAPGRQLVDRADVEVGEVASSPACAGSASRSSSASAARAPASSSLSRSASRCSTPKRCCSSTIASPSFAKTTSCWITACVPTTSAASPDATCSIIAWRALPLRLPVSQATVEPERREPLDELPEMLLGQDLGRRHQRALPAGVDRPPRRPARRPPSCPSRRRPAAAGASAAAGRGRRRSRRRRAAAPRSMRRAAPRAIARRVLPTPARARARRRGRRAPAPARAAARAARRTSAAARPGGCGLPAPRAARRAAGGAGSAAPRAAAAARPAARRRAAARPAAARASAAATALRR